MKNLTFHQQSIEKNILHIVGSLKVDFFGCSAGMQEVVINSPQSLKKGDILKGKNSSMANPTIKYFTMNIVQKNV